MKVQKIIRQQRGRFDRRFSVGPACWPFCDLLWIHTGEVRLTAGLVRKSLTLAAPAGILIFPDTPFEGQAVGGSADATVCHFVCEQQLQDGFILSGQDDGFHIQNLMALSFAYAQRGVDTRIRINLLTAILDCFAPAVSPQPEQGRLERAWSEAEDKLGLVRSLSDVAAFSGMSESAFRALHRRKFSRSAGRYLQELRFRKAEMLLATTGLNIREVSNEVGYAHPASFSAAFTKSRGKTPASWRKRCRRLA